MAARDDAGARRAQHDMEMRDLQTQVSILEEEISVLRRKLAESPRQVRVLEDRLHEAQANLAAVTGQNERLVATLKEAREQIIALKEEVDRLAQPPSGFGVFLEAREDGTVDIFTGGRKLRVNVSPAVDVGELKRGQEVMLNEALNVVEALEFEEQGEVVMLKELFADGERALVIAHADEERVIKLAEPLRGVPLRAGDSLMLEPRSGYAYEKIHKAEVEELVLEEVPDISYEEIGGLGPQIEQIRDAVELPYLHADLFREHQL
ncbi:MAG TPA: proteasome ATPase, partial [Thermomonospora sp.]|nr:proteasome ATPase [Thermomonospora sp.]